VLRTRYVSGAELGLPRESQTSDIASGVAGRFVHFRKAVTESLEFARTNRAAVGWWGARGEGVKLVKWGNIFTSQCSASSASWVPAMTKVPIQKLLAVRFQTHSTHRYSRMTGTFDVNRVPC